MQIYMRHRMRKDHERNQYESFTGSDMELVTCE